VAGSKGSGANSDIVIAGIWSRYCLTISLRVSLENVKKDLCFLRRKEKFSALRTELGRTTCEQAVGQSAKNWGLLFTLQRHLPELSLPRRHAFEYQPRIGQSNELRHQAYAPRLSISPRLVPTKRAKSPPYQ